MSCCLRPIDQRNPRPLWVEDDAYEELAFGQLKIAERFAPLLAIATSSAAPLRPG